MNERSGDFSKAMQQQGAVLVGIAASCYCFMIFPE